MRHQLVLHAGLKRGSIGPVLFAHIQGNAIKLGERFVQVLIAAYLPLVA